MLNRLKNRIVFKISAIIITCIVILCAALIFVSTTQLQQQYYKELKDIEAIVQHQFQGNMELLNNYRQLAESNPNAYVETAPGRQLQTQIESYVTSEDISNLYILYPDIIEQDGKAYIKVLAANQALIDDGLTSQSLYELTPEFRTALDEARTEKVGMTDPYDDHSGTWLSLLSPIYDSNNGITAYVGLDFDYGMVKDKFRSMIVSSILTGLAIMIVIAAALIYILNRTLRPIIELSRLTEQAAKGDLTVSIEQKSKDEIGILAGSFNTMIVNLRDLIQNVQHVVAEVNHSSQALTDNSASTTQAATKTNEVIVSVATGSKQQMLSTQESSRALEEMSSGIQNIAESASLASEASTEALSQADHNRQAVESYTHTVENIQQSVSSSADAIQQLGKLSEEIGNITTVITGIASQTHMLSLNAAIEAARAGEHGRGFSVVSNEIRKLAEQSRDASNQITHIVQRIQQMTTEAVEAMVRGSEDVGEITTLFHRMNEAFQLIVSSIGKISGQMQEVSAVSEEMSASSEEVTASIVELATISQDASQASDEVSRLAGAQLASIQQIADASRQVSDLSQNLEQLIQKFKIHA
ncbi:methyl-accepting chemotaxis protein [Marinicrinis sediminis]|uniref:Methyl-accepting chemotaxis protein n=1 Tax=Marinicrinis sediminis TaxID=1652465 RepID=A0ABW5REV5_9BACL